MQGHWGTHVAESYVSGLVFGFFKAFAGYCQLLNHLQGLISNIYSYFAFIFMATTAEWDYSVDLRYILLF